MDVFSEEGGQLCLVHLKIAPQEQNHIGIILVFLVDDGLAGGGRRDVQKIRKLLYGVHAGRFHGKERAAFACGSVSGTDIGSVR